MGRAKNTNKSYIQNIIEYLALYSSQHIISSLICSTTLKYEYLKFNFKDDIVPLFPHAPHRHHDHNRNHLLSSFFFVLDLLALSGSYSSICLTVSYYVGVGIFSHKQICHDAICANMHA